jgi:hypothetical protein
MHLMKRALNGKEVIRFILFFSTNDTSHAFGRVSRWWIIQKIASLGIEVTHEGTIIF